VILSLASPLLLGVYADNRLVKTYSSTQKTSEILLPLIMEILAKYAIDKMIYTRGPGSYMAIKLTYIMLKTIEITRDIPCFACSGFSFNGGMPIKAIGNLYFIKEKETIITKKYEQPLSVSFRLPESIQGLVLDSESTPDYRLPAV
jgi:tRNA A37 threonylcarbamoyladenosine modification protein TsaB